MQLISWERFLKLLLSKQLIVRKTATLPTSWHECAVTSGHT